MWDLPGPGLEPVSPALAGGFLTTELRGKSLLVFEHGALYIQFSQGPANSLAGSAEER